MFGRNSRVPGNALIARHMRAFFDPLPDHVRASPERIAEAYGKHLFHPRRRELVAEKKLARSPFHVGIGLAHSDFADITKRAALVSDTLLLSHNGIGPAHRVRALSRNYTEHPLGTRLASDQSGVAGTRGTMRIEQREYLTMHCPDLGKLGSWLIDAEPLLKAGLAWYLPAYAVSRQREISRSGSLNDGPEPESSANVPSALDFLVQTGRAVTESDVSPPHPIKSQVVRPVLAIDLPFLDGVGMADFSEITVQEFPAYTAFRSFLRQELLAVDTALNAVDSEREMVKIAHGIEDELRGIRSQMTAMRRKRAVAVSGAVIGAVGASSSPCTGLGFFQTAATVMGVAGAGGIWGIIQSAADNSPRALRDSPWYYIWVLTRGSERYQ